MCAADVHVAACLYLSIEVDDVVVADVGETTGEVPAAYLCHGVVLSFRRGSAMHDDLINDALRLLQAETPRKRIPFSV